MLDRWAFSRRKLEPDNPVLLDAVACIQWYLDVCRVRQVTDLPAHVQADLVRELRAVLRSPDLHKPAEESHGARSHRR
jgi:hypothetical protein